MPRLFHGRRRHKMLKIFKATLHNNNDHQKKAVCISHTQFAIYRALHFSAQNYARAINKFNDLLIVLPKTVTRCMCCCFLQSRKLFASLSLILLPITISLQCYSWNYVNVIHLNSQQQPS